jgi:hypothetical protein
MQPHEMQQQYQQFSGQFLQHPQQSAVPANNQFAPQQQVNQTVHQKKRKKKKYANPVVPPIAGLVASAGGQMILPQQFVQPGPAVQGQQALIPPAAATVAPAIPSVEAPEIVAAVTKQKKTGRCSKCVVNTHTTKELLLGV